MISRKQLNHLFCLLIAVFMSSGCLYKYAGENKKILFSFAPVDGISFKQKLYISRIKDLGPAGVQMDESESATRTEIKKTQTGWDVTVKTISMVMMRDGQKVDSPIVDLLSQVTVVYKLDSKGDIMDVTGYEKIAELINSELPASMAAQLSALMNSEALKQKDVTEWNGRIGDFVGKAVSIGDVWSGLVPINLPNGKSLDYTVKTKFAAMEPCGTNQCLRIEQAYDSADEAVVLVANDVLEKAFESKNQGVNPEELRPEVGGASVKGRVVRLIDPTTMLIYRERVERIVGFEMELPGAGKVPTKLTENRRYEYEY